MPRLFIGLQIPEHISVQLNALGGGLPGARWIEPNDFHLTLRFIGDIDRLEANEVVQTLENLRQSKVTVTLNELTAFGKDRPHSLIAKGPLNTSLAELQFNLEYKIRNIGLAPDTRKFMPHVTLARLKGASSQSVADYLTHRCLRAPLRFEATAVTLYSARASVGGGPYIKEATYPLF